MITVELKGDKRMVDDLAKMRAKAVPFAIRNALNTCAFEVRSIWQRDIKSTFTNRNTFTANSVRVEQASVTKLEARTGSVAPWLRTQEDGGVVHANRRVVAIPGPSAAGQAAGSGKRTRLVAGRFKLGAVQVAHPALHGGRRQKNAIAIAVARKQGKTVVLLTRPRGGQGLFSISGGKRKLKTRLLYDVSRGSVRVKPEPTLERSVAAVRPKVEHMMQAALTQQMQRLSIGT